LIVENAAITTQEMSERLSFSKRNIEYNVQKLKSLGIIDREGADKNGRWIIKD
jgi:predicted HTH transcriptional regulator